MIDNLIQEESLLENKVLILALDDFEPEHRALTGLVANKLQDYYSRPCIIVLRNEDGTYSGSLRAPDSIEAFKEFRIQCVNSGLCVYASGHDQAAGIKLTAKNIPALQDYFNERYSDVNMTPTYYCDFVLDAGDPELADIIYQLGQFSDFWGKGIEEPRIAVTGVTIGPGTMQLVGLNKGKPTLKFMLPNNVVCIKFGSGQEEFDSLCLPYDGVEQAYKATIVGKASVNEWNGTLTPQLLIEDYHVEEVEYVF